MPYIKQEDRNRLDNPIRGLVFALKESTPKQIDGKINYVVSKLLHELYPINYYNINKAIGVIECIKLELYRRIAVPYEDTKIKENGDI